MAYATVDELAVALRVAVTPANTDRMQACLDAAAAEIDHWLGDIDTLPLPEPPPALAVQVNVARAVEHWKAADVLFGAAGSDTIGVLAAEPGDDFAKHAADLMPLVQSFGVA